MKKEQDGMILMDYDTFEEWLLSTTVSRKITKIQNHHTWKPNYSSFKDDNHLTLLSGMKNYHVNTRGFSDIAQNITTFPDGTIAVCRSLNKMPAGIKGANKGAICIEHLGNFDIDGDEMTVEHGLTIVRLNALLCAKFNLLVDTNSIIYHHWYDLTTGKRTNGTGNTKSCPGTNFFGGNTIEDASTEFIPLVYAEYSNIVKRTQGYGTNYDKGIVTASKLNVRDGACLCGKVIDTLTRDDEVTIYNTVGNWYLIDLSGKWVYSKYIKIV